MVLQEVSQDFSQAVWPGAEFSEGEQAGRGETSSGSQPASSPARRSAPVNGLQADVTPGAAAVCPGRPSWPAPLASAPAVPPLAAPSRLSQPRTETDGGRGPTDTLNGLQSSV